jgi:NTP pyrophosphatase (non-canonical NTP hydrolase)
VGAWCCNAFDSEHATSLPQRGIRLLEEAVELAQAAGAERAMAHRLVDYVFDRPAGKIGQEIGGVSVTLLALANAAQLSADDEEQLEISRILAKPVEHFTARNQVKNAAGFNTSPHQLEGIDREH